MRDMNWKEQRVYDALVASGGAVTLRALALRCFPGVRPVGKADSQVRNSLRRLVAHGLVRRVGEGEYVAVELEPLTATEEQELQADFDAAWQARAAGTAP